MSKIEEVQEQMKADMEAMKEKMTKIMEVVMSMKRMMEVNAATVVAPSTATKMEPTHPLGFDQVNHPASDMVGQGGEALGSIGGPHFVQVRNKHSFPPYGLPPNYTPPNVAHTPEENVDISIPMPIEGQQPQFDHAHVSQPMGKTHEAPRDHSLADFEPYLEYATKGQAVGGVPLPNTLEGPQFCPLLQPLHFAVGKVPPAMRWRDLAAQVAPPMTEKEMITMIVDTLLVFYFEKMVDYMPSCFVNLVFTSKRIKVGLRRGKFDYPALMNRKPGANEENENEGGTHAMIPFSLPNTLSTKNAQSFTKATPKSTAKPGWNFQENKPVEFIPFPLPYADLLPYLLDNAMAVISLAKTPQPPFPKRYNPDMTCAYHGGVPGHSIEHCRTLKHKVQSLIDAG
ncbi:hypothetical protein HKD37_07G019615 [Glycine soja]